MSHVSIFPQTRAEVAQHGQRRRTEAPIPQGFVGSNPTLRTNLPANFFKHMPRKNQGKAETIKERTAYIYIPSFDMVEDWKKRSHAANISLSKFVLDRVEDSIHSDKGSEGYVSARANPRAHHDKFLCLFTRGFLSERLVCP